MIGGHADVSVTGWLNEATVINAVVVPPLVDGDLPGGSHGDIGARLMADESPSLNFQPWWMFSSMRAVTMSIMYLLSRWHSTPSADLPPILRRPGAILPPG